MNLSESLIQFKAQFGESIIEEVTFLDQTTFIVRKEQLVQLLSALKETPFGFEVLMDLTGVDYLQPIKQTKVIYFLHHPQTFIRLRIAVFVERGSSLPSVVSLWEGANWYERELFDLFGVKFDGHPHLERILMPDDWKGHPLLKDYALTEEPVEFKHDVKPKIPSRIIHVRDDQYNMLSQ